MVCTLVRGRMATMARLLATGNFPEIAEEEVNHDKFAVRAINKELHEANEANLLEEEDMHVFDCRPLTDPLHLVSCNSCKKPIKASQFAAHADRCRSLISTEDNVLGLDGGTGHKKPPRKGRKKLQTSHDNQATTIGEQERLEPKGGDDNAALEPNIDGPIGTYREAKRASVSIPRTVLMDDSGVSPGSRNYSGGVMATSKRRTKLITTLALGPEDCLETAYGVTTEMVVSCQEAPTYAPLPLATKMYHAQRSRLRTALGHLYRVALAKEHESNHMAQKLVRGNTVLSSHISPDNLLHKIHKDGILQKEKDGRALTVLRKHDQHLSQNSEPLSGTSGGWPSTFNFSNQFQDNNFLGPALSVDTAPMEMMRNNYLPTPYSFPGNSGATLGTMQKPDGSVSVT